MKKFNLAVLLFILGYSSFVSSEIYKCRINGKINFTDKPCDGEKIDLNGTNALPAVKIHESETAADKEYSSSKWYTNHSGYITALEIGQQFNVPVFIYFQADWCGWCRKLEKELLETPQGKKVLKKVVKVRITPEDGDKENQLFKKLGGNGYPTILIKKPSDLVPKKYHLMKKENDSWLTIPASHLKKIIGLTT